MNAGNTSSKIVHPPEDLSLEEIKARKLKHFTQNAAGVSHFAPRSTTAVSNVEATLSTNTGYSSAVATTNTSTVNTPKATPVATAAAIAKRQEVSSYYRY